MIYLFFTAFTVAFVLYTRFQLIDVKMEKGSPRRWHPFGWVMRATVVAIPMYYALTHTFPRWQDVLLAACINILVFEVGINVIALHKDFLYNGGTAQLDKRLGKWKWVVYLLALIGSAIIEAVSLSRHRKSTKP